MPNKRNIEQLEELTGLFKDSEYLVSTEYKDISYKDISQKEIYIPPPPHLAG